MGTPISTWNNEVSYDWEHDSLMRMGQAAPGDTARGLFFNGTLEAIRSLGGDEAVRRCLDGCGQERFVDFFNYPVELQLRMISAVMPLLEERYGSAEAVLRQLGRHMAMGFLRSTAGKMMLVLARRDPKRLVNSVPAGYRASVSYGTQLVEWTGPTSGRLILTREFMPPAVHAGVVEMLLEVGGVSEARVNAWQQGSLGTVCEFSWE